MAENTPASRSAIGIPMMTGGRPDSPMIDM